jgi:hypothetical protein
VDDVWFLKSEKGKRGLQNPRKRGGTKKRGDNNDQAKVLFSVDRSKNMLLYVINLLLVVILILKNAIRY